MTEQEMRRLASMSFDDISREVFQETWGVSLEEALAQEGSDD